MAVQTSQVTTAANGDLTISPNGTGQIVASPLAGSAAQAVGVDNAGELRFFSPAQLATGTPLAASEVMLDIGGVVQKASVQDLVDASDSISLADLSVTQNAATATSTGTLTYANATGVFTYTPPSAQGLGALSLTSLSAASSGTPTAGGGLSYDNTTGAFTYSPSLSYTGTNGVAFVSGSSTQFEVNIPGLPTR